MAVHTGLPDTPAVLTSFDLDQAWDIHPQVAVRPEPFGALLYHFGTRRLSFLKDPTLLAVVQSLPEHPSARAALEASGADVAQQRRLARSLATLAATDMITARTEASP
ncbi:mycofactocin biosynthesis chaperone MftB [Cryptosporangium aurantiacum]|uniref:Putative mycofactocin binding protein MftB n=1 Tax=Cryptosporangium aurantiacum TaxID=134849 RepID=A0A1M7RPA7_9ACTN|nr:mycofactocin biosynthesis chaperone MftB [Cryptosporangium aurantiacum]SHN48143.1 putative mycofactocin binding protein MftB [Cryptosporangium aurantiacum]